MSGPETPDVAKLRRRLEKCPAGHGGWQEYENVCIAVLTYLFVPPLAPPKVQARTLSGMDRRDAIFPNRVMDPTTAWGLLRKEVDARLITFEFKNLDRTGIGKEETDQVRAYMKPAMGRLAVVCSNKPPQPAALRRRNQIFSADQHVLLFLTTGDILEMIDMKGRGEDPGDFLVDCYELFLIQHE